jgi:hypothetical protein
MEGQLLFDVLARPAREPMVVVVDADERRLFRVQLQRRAEPALDYAVESRVGIGHGVHELLEKAARWMREPRVRRRDGSTRGYGARLRSRKPSTHRR